MEFVRPTESAAAPAGPKIPTPAPGLDKAASAERSLTELLYSVANGQQKAFVELYGRTLTKVLMVANSVLQDSGLAEEVAQEVFLEIWLRAGNFDHNRGSAISWVVTLARSRAVDRVRRMQAARTHDGAFARNSFEPNIDHVMDIVLSHAQHHQIRAALRCVTDRQRHAIELTFLSGLSYPEASLLLGIPLATLKARVRDGLIALRNSASLSS